MTRHASKEHAERTCAAEVSSSQVDAGADFTIKIKVTSPDDFDLVGQRVSIRGADHTELASAEITETDDAVFTGEISLRAPLTIGQQTWRAILPDVEDDDTIFDEISTSFSFVVVAHIARVQVWGIPTAISSGERFRMKVGVRCTSACNLAGRIVAVFDQGARKPRPGFFTRCHRRVQPPCTLPKSKRPPLPRSAATSGGPRHPRRRRVYHMPPASLPLRSRSSVRRTVRSRSRRSTRPTARRSRGLT